MKRNLITGMIFGGAVLTALYFSAGSLLAWFLILAAYGWLAYKNPLRATQLFIIYLPVQLALNLGPGLDVASSRLLALTIGAGWALNKLPKPVPQNPHPITYNLSTIIFVAFVFWAGLTLLLPEVAPLEPGLRKLLFLLSYAPIPFVIADLLKKPDLKTRNTKYGIRNTKQGLQTAIAISGSIAAMSAMAFLILGQLWGDSIAADWWLNNVTPLFNGVTAAAAIGQYSSWFARVGANDVLRAVGTFPDPHMLAFFLELTLPFTMAKSITYRVSSIKYILFWASAALLQLAILLLTFSRGAYLGLMAGTVVAAAMYLYKRRRRPILHATLYILPIILLALLLLFNTPFAARLTNLFDSSTAGRLTLWQQSIEIIKTHPVAGVGLGNLPYEINPAADYRDPLYAHNLYLDIAAETGLIGLMLWAILIIAIFKRQSWPGHAYRQAGRIALIAISAHALFDTPLFSAHVLPLLLIL